MHAIVLKVFCLFKSHFKKRITGPLNIDINLNNRLFFPPILRDLKCATTNLIYHFFKDLPCPLLILRLFHCFRELP